MKTQKEKLEAEENKNKPIIIKAYNTEFQIHIWENKPFKDFPMPKGFDFADASQVDKLVNDNLFKPEQFKWYVFKQRYKINKNYGLSGLYLNWYLSLGSYGESVADSDSDGRVILQKVKK